MRPIDIGAGSFMMFRKDCDGVLNVYPVPVSYFLEKSVFCKVFTADN